MAVRTTTVHANPLVGPGRVYATVGSAVLNVRSTTLTDVRQLRSHALITVCALTVLVSTAVLAVAVGVAKSARSATALMPTIEAKTRCQSVLT